MNDAERPRSDALKRWLGPRWTVRARCVLRGLGLPRWGNLRRTKPFSQMFGFDRGTPVDRYYLEQFLEAHRDFIQGRVLEIQSSGYTGRYGQNLIESHSVDISPQFGSTYVCDLAQSEPTVPSNYYDCFLLPNTLCVLRDIESSLRHAERVVKPGGVVLATTAAFVPLTPDGRDYWHLSAAGWSEVAGRAFEDRATIQSHGNCLTATAAMMGLAMEELTAEELEVNDPRYPVLITILYRKPFEATKRDSQPTTPSTRA